MGANIRRTRLHEARQEDEVSRLSRNFVKGETAGARRLNSFDHGTYLAGGFVPDHMHEAVEEVFYFIRGRGVVRLGEREVLVGPGCVVAVPPGTLHGIRNTGKEVLQHVVCSAKVLRPS